MPTFPSLIIWLIFRVFVHTFQGMWAERSVEQAKYSRSSERVLIQRPERWFHFGPVPFRYLWQYKAIHWLKQTERGRGARLIWWKTSGIAPSFKFERAWSDFTGAEWNFRWAESGLWAELSGITLSDGAHISGERKFSPLSSAHMLWYIYNFAALIGSNAACNLLVTSSQLKVVK